MDRNMTTNSGDFAETQIITILNGLKAKHGKAFTDAIHTFLQTQKPFSEAKFSFVAKSFGLSTDPQDPFAGWADLAPEIPSVLLPSSIVNRIIRSTVDSFVSPGSIPELGNEAATGLFLSGTFQTIVCLFGGVLRDRPEKSVPGTDLSSGGKVEGEVFCKDQMLIFLRELKHRLGGKEFADHVAQVICEIYAVWHLNRQKNIDIPETNLIPVVACLYDGMQAHFIAFNGVDFKRRSFPAVTLQTQGLQGVGEYFEHTLQVSSPVHEYTFAVLLSGYYNTLRLYYERTVSRGEKGDASAPGSHRAVTTIPVPPLMGEHIDRLSAEGWQSALELAYEARECFRRAKEYGSDQRAEEGLDKLSESLGAWSSDIVDLCTPSMAEQKTVELFDGYLNSLGHDPDPLWKPQFPRVFPLTAQERRKRAVDDFGDPYRRHTASCSSLSSCAMATATAPWP
ncbi:hypothetical protein B0H13DRAFT_2362113 [Mycena leptocephala]|nr:hypothetical protein B0H13DRAFT_2362113 [Mycena leptocephala]